MSGTTGAGSYRAVLSLPHAAHTFGAALVGRLAFGLLPLSLLLTVHDATGSFAVAGSAVAVLGATSLSLPLKSRLVDRHGQPLVLVPLALTTGVALAAITLLAEAGTTSSSAAYLVLAAVAGLASPPLGPAMRATWRLLTEGSALRTAAYALDATGEEALYLLGPLLTGVLVSLSDAATSLLATSALLVVGTLTMTTSPPSRRRPGRLVRERQHVRPRGPLRSGPFLAVLGALLPVAVALGVVSTSLAGRAQATGDPGVAGFLEAAMAAGSVLGAWAWGRRRHRRTHWRHLAGMATWLAVGAAGAVFTPGLVTLGVVLAVAGVAVAPLLVVCFLAADELSAEHVRTEAGTWVTTTNNLGSAAGTSLGGLVVDGPGAGLGFVLAALLFLVSAAWAWRRER